ncbi:peptidoglycan editing factor PgeF [Paenibacillus humicola]|uniref:peptidoglycan editing factor PgeF n=1 Tax=Paenibacillus humicola TaxID=3110540 RepID=UPI00237AE42E|nr:peptidoglycan editing factor PgeF [Paenibacillus humicola]
MEPFERYDSAKGPSLFLLPQWAKLRGGLTAGFSSRLGGVSAGPWSSLNCGLHVGDEPDAAVRNRERIAEEIGWPFEAWTCAEQVHGSRVYRVTAEDRGRGRLSRESSVGDADALITGERGVLLTSFYADCVPLYLFDPHRGVIALAHAGWKGTVLQIARAAVEALAAEFGCDPADIRAAIGPSIGLCCYEVGGEALRLSEELASMLEAGPLPDARPQEPLIAASEGGKARINLKEMNRQIMIKAGILPTHIEMTEWCTGCSTDLFFSHRKEGGKTGRMVSWIGMERGDADS